MAEEDIKEQNSFLPKSVHIAGSIISFIISILIIAYIVAFMFGCVKVPPKELDLTNLLLFSLTCFLFFAIPWNKLGLSLKKFGPIEFEKLLEGQSEENIINISELEDKIEALELKLLDVTGNHNVLNEITSDQPEFETLITNFLKEFSEWSFSPLRMEHWGAKQPGYSELANNPKRLRSILRKLVAKGILETKISKKGNTLYRIKE